MRYFLYATTFLAFLLSGLAASQGRLQEVPDKHGTILTVVETMDRVYEWQASWKLNDGGTYVSEDRERSLEPVLQIRRTMLESEHAALFEGWDIGGDRLAPEGEHTGQAGVFSFRIDLGGEPSIVLSCEDTRFLGYLDEPEIGMIPTWKVRVGDRTWTTRSRRVTSAASLLCPDRGLARHAFYSLDARFENFESPLRELCQDWSGYSELNRRLKLIETREFPTAIHFEFKVRRPVNLSHVTWGVHSPENDDNRSGLVPQEVADRYISLARRHGYHLDPQAGPAPTWEPLLAELEMAEKLVSRHHWIGRLREEGVIERVHLTTIRGLMMKEWPLEEEPDIQLELSGRGWSSEVLISDEGGQAFAPDLGPQCTRRWRCPATAVADPSSLPKVFPSPTFRMITARQPLSRPTGQRLC